MPAQPPVINVTVQDGSLGQLPSSTNNLQIKLGYCSLTQTPQVIAISSPSDVKTLLGGGPLADACANTVQNAGLVYAVPCAAATNTGAVTAVTANGTPPTLTITGTPVDFYQVLVKVVTAGTLTAAVIQYSLDNGNTWSANATTAATIGPLTEPVSGVSTGLTLGFGSGSYTTAHSWSFATSAPTPTAAEYLAAWTVALADPRTWGITHFVGTGVALTDLSNDATHLGTCASLATSIDSMLSTATSGKRYVRAIMEMCDQVAVLSSTGYTDTTHNTQTTAFDTLALTAFTSSVSTNRLGVAAGYCDLVSPMSGLIRRRSAAWPIATRLSSSSPVDDPGWVGGGSLPGVVRLWRDERVQTAADAGRLMSLRTWQGYPGYFATSGIMWTTAGSDYSYVPNGRVIDILSTAVYAAAIPFINQSLRVNPNGTIYESDARVIESVLGAAASAAVVQPGYVSPSTSVTPLVVVNRTNNFLSTGILYIAIRATALGYARDIELSVGFNRAALVAATQ